MQTQTQIQGTLYQFWYSHFNEKGRWILDYLGVPYRMRTLAPGLHLGPMKKLSGQTSTPVFVHGERLMIGSGEIARALIDEPIAVARPASLNRPPLLPPPGKERDQILGLCQKLDAEVGSDHRRALFHYLFATDRGAVKSNFSIGSGIGTRIFYALTMPVMVSVLRKIDDINPTSAERGEAQMRATLDWIAEHAGRDGYLVGDRFTLADLTAAALLFPIVNPPEMSFAIPPRSQKALDGWKAKFADTPLAAREWIARIFRQYR